MSSADEIEVCAAPRAWPSFIPRCFLERDSPLHAPAEDCERLSDAPCPAPAAHHAFVPEPTLPPEGAALAARPGPSG
jgi:hypothetical protein